MKFVKLDPPFLDTEAMMSVFNVGVAMFSSNTTILDVLGSLDAVKAFETIVVEVVAPQAEAEINTYPSSPSF